VLLTPSAHELYRRCRLLRGGAGDGRPRRGAVGRPAAATAARHLLRAAGDRLDALLQLTAFPALLAALQRDPTGLAHGQPWRLGPSLTVQDGDRPGTVFNLTILAVVGVTAESLWSRPRW
jgi:hypothetical protein